MDKIVHFEIPVEDMERAKEFYQTCFKWEIGKMPDTDYNFVKTTETDDKQRPKEVGAINGGFVKRDENQPVPTLVINVEDIHLSVDRVRSAGGDVFTGVFNVGAMGLYALFKDTEGNILGLWQDISH